MLCAVVKESWRVKAFGGVKATEVNTDERCDRRQHGGTEEVLKRRFGQRGPRQGKEVQSVWIPRCACGLRERRRLGRLCAWVSEGKQAVRLIIGDTGVWCVGTAPSDVGTGAAGDDE